MIKKDAFYFKHDSNARSDLKIRRLIKRYGWQGYGWWWVLIEIMREQANYLLEYGEDTFDALSSEIGFAQNKEAQDFIDFLLSIKLLQRDSDGNLFSARLCADMKYKDDLREIKREAILKRWGKELTPLDAP